MLVIAHREELLFQARSQFRRWNPDLQAGHVGIEMAGSESARQHKVVIASVQSLVRRLWRFSPEDFDVIVCDEAHHSAASSYLKVFDHFRLREPDNKKLLLGVTATPFRADDKELIPGVYQGIIYEMPILQAIQEGWLCDLRSFRIETNGVDLDQVKTRAGDFAEDQLEKTIDTPVRNGVIVKEWQKLSGSRRTLVFAVTIQHAQHLAAAFGDYHVKAQAVWGDDPDRGEKLREHKRGEIQVLCNCALLTEGYDDRGIECIVMARPTLSRVLFKQMIGRGTRVEEGITNLVEARWNALPVTKPECHIIDVVDNTKRHDLVTLPSLFNITRGFQGKCLTEICKQSGEITNPYLNSAELQQVERAKVHVEEVDLFRGRRGESSGATDGVKKVDSFIPKIEPPGSGFIKAWEDNNGFWKIEGIIDGVQCFLPGLTRDEAKSKAEALASRKFTPPPLPPVPRRPWRFKKKSQFKKKLPPMTVCPNCRQPVGTQRLQRHLEYKCPKRIPGKPL
jgi:superfamily II DNA or RNA helicase